MENDTPPELKNLASHSLAELLPEIGVSIQFIDNFTWIVSVIIVLVVSLGLSNTLMITFFEREQEFNTLNIIGARTRWITASLMIEVFAMGTISVIIGALFGYLATTFLIVTRLILKFSPVAKAIIMGGMTIAPLVRIYSSPRILLASATNDYFS